MLAAIVLAAGQGSRFGSQKLLAPIRTKPLVRVTVENVLTAAVDDVVVVVGRDADGVQAALVGLQVRFAENRNYANGMSTSVMAGIEALLPGTDLALIALGDQPGITPNIIRRLIEAQRVSRKPIVVPMYAGQRGNPVLFRSDFFPELATIHGDHGARDLILSDPERVEFVEFPFPPPADIDTRQDYDAMLQLVDGAIKRK
ncbi:MAG: nucleotidyltransferase family protein [Anaerolineae bacterium]|nr:nucleotidyltransferase family protein [Gemmatimonadaceae bacterium]